jgi:hypothetical protein
MQLDKRQKILAGALGGTVALFWGLPIIWDLVFGPFTFRYQQIDALKNTLNEKETAQHKLDISERLLANADRRSLPSDQSSLAYQVWLTELANKHNFTSVGVAPKPPNQNNNEPFLRTRITVTGHCKMKDLSEFLYNFYRTDLLQKVTNLTVKTSEAKSDPELEVTIDIEGLSMKTTKKRDSLFEGKQAESVSDLMAKKSMSDYELLYKQNRFARGYNGPTKATVAPAPVVPFDSLPYIKYVGYTGFADDEQSAEGWLLDQTTGKNRFLKVGSDFEAAGIKATVTEITGGYITFKIKDKTWRVEQGDSLKQMQELSSDGKPIGPKPTAPMTPATPASSTPTPPTSPAGAPGSAPPSSVPAKEGTVAPAGDVKPMATAPVAAPTVIAAPAQTETVVEE